MHPDKKVGLALGILLIGITGAFFFRNEAPSDESPAGQLTSAESLDRRIDRSGIAPYAAADQSAHDETALADVPEVAVSDIVPEIPEAGLFRETESLPEPLRAESDTDVLAPLPRPDALTGQPEFQTGRPERNGSRSLSSDAPRHEGSVSDVVSVKAGATPDSKSAGTTVRPTATPQRIHEVVPGDNLSTLAQRYLGSQSKYLKLYEANRDVLKSPDDLRIGMKLKIPVEVAPKSATATDTVAPQAAPQRSADAQTAPRISSKPSEPTFVKPAKSPVVPKSREASDSGKSVGQVPPPDLPKVEGLLPEAKPPVIASRPENKD